MLRLVSCRWFSKAKDPLASVSFDLPFARKWNDQTKERVTLKVKTKPIPLEPHSQEEQFRNTKVYEENYKDKIIQNNKQNLFYQYDYAQGEPLIDDVPMSPFYSFRIAELLRKRELQQKDITDFLRASRNPFTVAEEYRAIASCFDEKQRKFEIEEYEAYLRRYPGSKKGPRPEDDFAVYMAYAAKQMPKFLAAQLKTKNSSSEDTVQSNRSVRERTFIQATSSYIDSFESLREDITEMKDQDEEVTDENEMIDINTPFIEDNDEFMAFPPLDYKGHQDFMRKLSGWQKFISSTHASSQISQLDRLKQKVQEFQGPVESQDPLNEFVELKPIAPSLYLYYKTLPKFIQENAALKVVYVGLEFHSPDWSFEQKEDMLNYAASLCLPLDPVTERAMRDFASKKKYYMTPVIAEKIFTMAPEFTWDFNQFMAEIKREQLRGKMVLQENQTSYPEPPELHKINERHLANLPVDYYENDDGFWDSIIEQRIDAYDAAKPLLKTRRHLKH